METLDSLIKQWLSQFKTDSHRPGYEVSETYRHLWVNGKLEPAKVWPKKEPIE